MTWTPEFWKQHVFISEMNNSPRKQTSGLWDSHSQETKRSLKPMSYQLHLATVFPFTFLGCGHTAMMYVKQNKIWAYEQSLRCQSSKTRKLSWHLQIWTFTTALCRDKTGDTNGNQPWLKIPIPPHGPMRGVSNEWRLRGKKHLGVSSDACFFLGSFSSN